MFKTIKSKIFLIILSTLSALILVFAIFSFIYFKSAKRVFIDASYLSIYSLAQNINTDISKIEDNAHDMAIFGEVFYNLKKDQRILDEIVSKTIGDYSESISGGIWYEPYTIDSKQERFCSFAYLSHDDKILIDENYKTEEKSYLKSVWYKDLMKEISEGKDIAWSLPYYEPNGIQSYMITAGIGIYNKGKLVGLSTADWGIDAIIEDVSTIQPTPNSFLLFADPHKDFILVSTDKFLDNKELFGKSLKSIPWYDSKTKNKTSFKYHNKMYVQYISHLNNGLVLIINVPENELYALIMTRFTIVFSILIFFSIILCLFIYLSLKRNIIEPINKMMDIAEKIGCGETDLTIKIDKPAEFAKLAKSFDKMTNDLKDITAKQTVLESELMIARSIQINSLPSIFPPYPETEEFDIYASMTPAKEVGGDFYDFYFVAPHTFVFLIADVSGKGIPAALFMMTVKTLINNVSQTSSSPEELIEVINRKICANNKENLFVTLFAGVADILTGEIYCINCGHNPPLIKSNGSYDFLNVPANIALGAFPDSKFEVTKIKLNPGDKLFLYTDGITEAFNGKEEMFGAQRLKEALNNNSDLSLRETLSGVRKCVTEFTENREQDDDITMLLFDYKGYSDKKTFKDNATFANYQKFYQMLLGCSIMWELDEDIANKIYMCAEEVYANVVNHAYSKTEGIFEAEFAITDSEITLTCIDTGTEYNPLEKEDPDINLPPEERPLGGLGIFMIKNLADEISYTHTENKNILTMKFKRK